MMPVVIRLTLFERILQYLKALYARHHLHKPKHQ